MKNKLLLILLSSTAILACTSCASEDRTIARFDKIESEISTNYTKINETNSNVEKVNNDVKTNSSKIDELSDSLDQANNDINETNSNVEKVNNDVKTNSSKIDELSDSLDQANNDIKDIIYILETPEKSIEEIRNEQIGLSLIHYFDSVARAPEAIEYLNEAKELLFNNIGASTSLGKIYGIASIFGSNSDTNEFEITTDDGVFDAIARQPEYHVEMISFGKMVLKAIAEQKLEICAKMLGFGTASAFEAFARQPEISDSIFEYTTYIIGAYGKLKFEESAYAIGYASKGFYNSIARQPEAKEELFGQFKNFIDTKIEDNK
ncbi:MAG: hypothetical protein MJ222_03205 [Bacilli bacterium]|nr:hypothetical protein [Bacilli bacterium]